MGNPSSGCAPVRSPMTPFRRHRHSLSISSLPQDKLLCSTEKRGSLSAFSSPAKDVPLTNTHEKVTIAKFLGHGKPAKPHHDYFARRRAPGSGAEDLLQLKRAIAGHEGKTSFNPFRGHRRVSSANISPSSTEFSPRNSPSSKRYGVPKIAGSLFHTKKLERSDSLPKTDREVITSASNKRTSNDSDSTMNIQQESPRISSASTQQKIIDITNMLETESEADNHARRVQITPPRSGAVSMRRSCKTTAEIGIQISPSCAHDEELRLGHEHYITALFDDEDEEEEEECDSIFPTEESLCYEVTDMGVQCNLLDEEEQEEEEEEEEEEGDEDEDEDEEEYYSDASDESLVAVSSCDMEVGPHQAVLRKRRRSVSASGIGAMLLKVVRGSDSSRRGSKAGSPEKIRVGLVEALRARQYVLEKTAQFSMGPAFEEMITSRACRPESEDAIKSTYSKFVDIEIESGGHCIELVQQYTDHVHLDGAGSPFQAARHRSRQATPGSSPGPSHLHYYTKPGASPSPSYLHHHHHRQTTPGSSPSPSHLHYHTSSHYNRSRNATPGSSPSLLHYHASNSNSRNRGSSPSPSHLHYHASSNSRTTPGSSPSPYHASSNFSSRQATPVSSSSPGHLHCPVHQEHTKEFSPFASPIKHTEAAKYARMDPGKHSLQDYFETVDDMDKVPFGSRTIVSRLQAPASGAFSRVDVYRPGASTVSILSNPSFSSSHQDRLWEEQAEVYSSGGRGTPGRDELEPGNIIINLRKSSPYYHDDQEVLPQHEGRQRASHESGHFMQQFMTRVRGSLSPQRRSSSAGLPPRPAAPPHYRHGVEQKRRNTWSSCICFSNK